MTELATGIRSVLSHPAVYNIWSRVVGGKRARVLLVRDHVRPWRKARVLDLGCGTGELLDYLGEVSYTGIDLSEDYISAARRRFDRRGEFLVGDATRVGLPRKEFDLALAFGVIHHLDDPAAKRLFTIAANALVANGRMITIDAAFVHHQNRAARFVIARDRGQNVRAAEEYASLAAHAFGVVRSVIRSDLIRIPYTHCLLECEQPRHTTQAAGRADVGVA